jgi:ribosomal protein S18 acetylase RimI-like enzyme
MSDHSQTSNVLSMVTLRPVGPADEPLLLEIYASTRAEEMALVPWTREQQLAFVKMQFAAQQEHYRKIQPDASHDVIVLKDRPIGRLYVARTKEKIEIMDIVLLPQERNAGIGSYLIKALMDEATRSWKPLRIYVESFNPSLRLFERLNFRPVEEHGIHLLMEWVPNNPPPIASTA